MSRMARVVQSRRVQQQAYSNHPGRVLVHSLSSCADENPRCTHPTVGLRESKWYLKAYFPVQCVFAPPLGLDDGGEQLLDSPLQLDLELDEGCTPVDVLVEFRELCGIHLDAG
eukprot:3537705-Rhodomonas_salina.3